MENISEDSRNIIFDALKIKLKSHQCYWPKKSRKTIKAAIEANYSEEQINELKTIFKSYYKVNY